MKRHIESLRDRVNSSGPQPVDVYGITDNNDWDPAAPGFLETEITWNNAPRNDAAAGNAFEDSAGVPKLIPGYDFDLGGDGVVELEGAKYALDITKYARESLTNDADKKITVLMAIATQMIDGCLPCLFPVVASPRRMAFVCASTFSANC